MQMNEQSYHRLILPLLLAAVSIPVIAAGPENQTSTANQTPVPSEEASQAPPEADTATPDTQQAAEKTSPASGAAVTPLKEFKPTEKIDADSAVSFPIDI
ncbi:MAG: hypothetical protein QNK19_10220 [Xanthomonadales bacterium]|nr:hypothetical protein [Xanthomonadales bacterium]